MRIETKTKQKKLTGLHWTIANLSLEPATGCNNHNNSANNSNNNNINISL